VMTPPTRPISTSVTPQPPADGQAQDCSEFYTVHHSPADARRAE
jgi:hypothetical protein